MVQLLEGELLNLKKQQLLAQIDLQYSFPAEESKKNPIEEDESIQELIEEFNGQECSVPFQFQNGKIEFHDAILKSHNDDQSRDYSIEELKFKVCQIFLAKIQF